MLQVTLVIDLSASLYLGVVDAQGNTLARRIRVGAKGETAHALLDECLDEAGIGPDGISALCVGAGPGSFTGIRVGVALAQGLAFARRLPLYPYSSLSAMRACAPVAAGDSAATAGNAIAAIGANAGRYYAAWAGPGEKPDAWDGNQTQALIDAEALRALSDGKNALVTSGPMPAGNGPVPPESAFASVHRFEDIADFGRIAALAMAKPPVLDGVVRPNYLSASAAEEKRKADLEARARGSVSGAPGGTPA